MAKAGLLEAQSPVVNGRTLRNDAWNRCRVRPWHEPVGRGCLRDAGRRPARAVKEMSGRPVSRSTRTTRTYRGIACGREPYGDGVPVVVAGATTCQGGRESRAAG